MKKTAWLFIFSFFFAISSLSASSNEVRDYERLRLLQTATGVTPTGDSSFEARVDTLLNPGNRATPAFDSQARVDYAYTQKVEAKAKEDALQVQKNVARNRKAELGYLPKGDDGLAGTNMQRESKIPSMPDQFKDKTSYVDGSEENYQSQIEKKLQEENKAMEGKNGLLGQSKKEGSAEAKSDELPSLANNPFYFSGNVAQTRVDDFEANKPLILSRMVQSAIPANEAENILVRSSTPEEVILAIMEGYAKPYGIAKDLVDTGSKKKSKQY